MQLQNFDVKHFMRHYWQQKPVVLRAAFPHFQDLISPEELAGLACEEEVESRLVYQREGRWQAETGPFFSYDHLGERGWTLIVQAVNHWSPEVAELVSAFAFIPKWRLDDVMISYSTPDGGVGPHIDLYDVFICQGSGRRRWRVVERGNHREFAAHPALLHTDAFDKFDAIIDTELLPGDILYIPPGFPHDGVSLETAMSFSVGFRSKSARDMMSGLADYLIDQQLGNTLISDPQRPIATEQGRISHSDFALIRAQLQNILDDDNLIADFAASLLSKTKCQLDLQTPDDPYLASDLLEQFQTTPLRRTGGLRCFYVDQTVAQGACYIDGERYVFGAHFAPAVVALCDKDELHYAMLAAYLPNSAEDQDPAKNKFLQCLCDWVNTAYWYFD